MVKLQEYIGALISSVATGRVLADLQTVTLAEEYAKNSLLAHFPVPRMRIRQVQMTVPVAIDAIQLEIENEYELLDGERFPSLTYREILRGLDVRSLPRETARALKEALAENFQTLEARIRVHGNEAAIDFATIVATTTLEILRTTMSDRPFAESSASSVHDTIATRIRKLAHAQIRVRTSKEILESLRVTVEADKLREKRPEDIVYIKLDISEDGVEWHMMETSDGKIASKLLPE
jgi:hypothetical protein